MLNVKIPEGYSPESVRAAMDVLRNDPNFATLAAVVQANDIARLRETVEDPTVDEKELRAAQYKLAVFKEFLSLPTKLFDAVGRAQQKPEEEVDTYHTAQSLEEARGQ